MGLNSSKNDSTTTENLDAQIFLTRKEYEFIILETEVDEAINTKNKEHLKRIKEELTSLYKTVRILQKDNNWSKIITERSDRLLYNYEFVLAKVVSALNAAPPERPPPLVANTRRPEAYDVDQEINSGVEQYKNDLENYIRITSEQPSAPPNDGVDDHVYGKINKISTPSTSAHSPQPPYKTDLSDIARKLQETDEEDEDEQLYANIKFQGTISGRRYPILSQIINKPPIPIPRNQQEIIIKEMPKYFTKLNNILEKTVITEEDVQEVYLIRRKCNEVKDMFVDKANHIFEKYEKQDQ